MKNLSVPKELVHLRPLVEKWGLGDDGYRDEQIENANNEELKIIVDSLPESLMIIMNEWLEREEHIQNPTPDFLDYTAYLMAYEYAESVLSNRLNA